MVCKGDIEKDLRRMFDECGKLPTQRMYDKDGAYSRRTVCIKYGSWNNALSDIFGSINRVYRSTATEIECFNSRCSELTTNPKFCSISCSSSYNNMLDNGRKIGRARTVKRCRLCDIELSHNRRVKCDDCCNKIKTRDGNFVDYENVTKGMVLTNDTQKYRRIRGMAREVALKHGKLDSCFKCGYSLHVECAHIISLHSFDEEAKISEINHINNILGLCPNHHWEFDNGFLKF